MALNKSTTFGAIEVELAAWSAALSHPARVAILKTLAQRQTCICGEIVEVLPLAQSTVSQHLKALKEAGLIKGTLDGPKSCYCINQEAFDKLQVQFQQFFTEIKESQSSNECC